MSKDWQYLLRLLHITHLGMPLYDPSHDAIVYPRHRYIGATQYPLCGGADDTSRTTKAGDSPQMSRLRRCGMCIQIAQRPFRTWIAERMGQGTVTMLAQGPHIDHGCRHALLPALRQCLR